MQRPPETNAVMELALASSGMEHQTKRYANSATYWIGWIRSYPQTAAAVSCAQVTKHPTLIYLFIFCLTTLLVAEFE